MEGTPLNNKMLSTQQFHDAFVNVKPSARRLLMNSDKAISLTQTPELPRKFNMYKLDSNRDGRNIDQKNTLLSLFSKPGDRTSNAAD